MRLRMVRHVVPPHYLLSHACAEAPTPPPVTSAAPKPPLTRPPPSSGGAFWVTLAVSMSIEVQVDLQDHPRRTMWVLWLACALPLPRSACTHLSHIDLPGSLACCARPHVGPNCFWGCPRDDGNYMLQLVESLSKRIIEIMAKDLCLAKRGCE